MDHMDRIRSRGQPSITRADLDHADSIGKDNLQSKTRVSSCKEARGGDAEAGKSRGWQLAIGDDR